MIYDSAPEATSLRHVNYCAFSQDKYNHWFCHWGQRTVADMNNLVFLNLKYAGARYNSVRHVAVVADDTDIAVML